MRLLFIGASKFGLRCLQESIKLPDVKPVGIITNPETFSISYNPDGVRNVLHADFRQVAEENEIPVHVMEGKMNDPALLEQIEEWAPDFILVVGWYHMVPKKILNIAPTAGLHASLLPSYSGGAPLVWAIINGETETGISLFYFDRGVDNGPLIGQKQEPIHHDDTIATLYSRIEERGLELLREYLPMIAKGTAPRIIQDESKRTIMPQRSPADGEIDWNRSSTALYNFIRAQTRPYPGAFTRHDGRTVKVWEVELREGALTSAPGEWTALSTGETVVRGSDDTHHLLLSDVEYVEV